MKSFYQLTVAIVAVLALVMGISHAAFAQANDIKGGPPGRRRFSKRSKSEWRQPKRKSQ